MTRQKYLLPWAILLSLFFVGTTSPSIAQSTRKSLPDKRTNWTTSPHATQSDMNVGANEDFREADAKLNSTYKQIQQLYKDDKLFLTKLKKAQLAWVAFRDAHMQSRYPLDPEEYGSAFSMCYSLEMANLTNERTKQLKKWVDGIEEGDVCSGSYHIRQ